MSALGVREVGPDFCAKHAQLGSDAAHLRLYRDGRDSDRWRLSGRGDTSPFGTVRCWYYAAFYFVGLVIATRSEDSRLFRARWKLFFVISIPWAAEEVLMNPGWRGINPNSLSQLLAPTLLGLVMHSGFVLIGPGNLASRREAWGLGCLLLLSDRQGTLRRGLHGPVARVCLSILAG